MHAGPQQSLGLPIQQSKQSNPETEQCSDSSIVSHLAEKQKSCDIQIANGVEILHSHMKLLNEEEIIIKKGDDLWDESASYQYQVGTHAFSKQYYAETVLKMKEDCSEMSLRYQALQLEIVSLKHLFACTLKSNKKHKVHEEEDRQKFLSTEMKKLEIKMLQNSIRQIKMHKEKSLEKCHHIIRGLEEEMQRIQIQYEEEVRQHHHILMEKISLEIQIRQKQAKIADLERCNAKIKAELEVEVKKCETLDAECLRLDAECLRLQTQNLLFKEKLALLQIQFSILMKEHEQCSVNSKLKSVASQRTFQKHSKNKYSISTDRTFIIQEKNEIQPDQTNFIFNVNPKSHKQLLTFQRPRKKCKNGNVCDKLYNRPFTARLDEKGGEVNSDKRRVNKPGA